MNVDTYANHLSPLHMSVITISDPFHSLPLIDELENLVAKPHLPRLKHGDAVNRLPRNQSMQRATRA